MKGLGIPFEVRTKEVNEDFDPELQGAEIPLYLAEKKANAFKTDLSEGEILVTSDTVVWLGNHVFNKPENVEEAVAMITELEGRAHEVITAVCLTSTEKQVLVSETTTVHFGLVEREAIEWYVSEFKPFDKAGAYGIQEWIGYVGIEKIAGSFYNVMGFPTRLFYTELKKFIES